MSIEEYIGIPFKNHGRDLDGFDCWGFCIHYCKGLNRELPDFQYEKSDDETMGENYEKILMELGNKVTKVREPEKDDFILFKNSRGLFSHIGISLGNRRFIHCDLLGVRVLTLEHYNRQYEAYRWQQ